MYRRALFQRTLAHREAVYVRSCLPPFLQATLASNDTHPLNNMHSPIYGDPMLGIPIIQGLGIQQLHQASIQILKFLGRAVLPESILCIERVVMKEWILMVVLM